MNAPANVKYQTSSWKTYNAALKTRGLLLIWLARDMSWHGSVNGKRGRNPKYSEAAIQFCLTIKGLFNLALRQAMGMAEPAQAGWSGLASARFQHRQPSSETPAV